MVLIPNVLIDQFRLITLGNYLFKVTTKIINDRLVAICFQIIFPNQYVFIRGFHIGDCTASAFQCVNVFINTSQFGHLALNIDICKAFDSISWPFFFEVLRCFGFSESFISQIIAIFDSTKLSMIINGFLKGYFRCSRGVRQGDPLSLLLFCLAKDYLSMYVIHLVDLGFLLLISSLVARYAPTHFLYMYDILLFFGLLLKAYSIFQMFLSFITPFQANM